MGEVTEVLFRTLQCSFVATCCVSIPGIPLAYFLSRYSFKGKSLISALIGLPLVVPPTAVGFLLLDMLGQNGFLGRALNEMGVEVVLTWKGIVLAGAVMSAPLVIRTAKVAFDGVPRRLETMAWTLGTSPVKAFFGVTLPLAYRGLMAAFILGFTRAMGEFGATVVLAGNIPGKTQTIASAIFSAQQTGQSDRAYFFIGIAVLIGFAAIVFSEILSRNRWQQQGIGHGP